MLLKVLYSRLKPRSRNHFHKLWIYLYTTGCFKKGSMKNFNSDLLITLIHSSLISSDSINLYVLHDVFSLRKAKVFALQILQRYLMKEDCVRKFFHCLSWIWIKEPWVRKFEGLERSKLLGISQTILLLLFVTKRFNSSFLVRIRFSQS